MSNDIKHANSAGNGGYERSDIGAKGVLYFLLGLAVAGLFTYFIVDGLYSYLDKRSEAQQAPVNPLVTNAPADTRHIPNDYPQGAFPNPKLEEDERGQLNDVRLKEEQTLQYLRLHRPEGGNRSHPDRSRDGPDRAARTASAHARDGHGSARSRTEQQEEGKEVSRQNHNSVSAVRTLLAVVLLAATAWGQAMTKGIMSPPSNVRPPNLQNVGIEQHLDAQVPADLAFVDDAGRAVKLGDYFGKKPLILNLVYYNCTMLCGEVLSGLTGAMKMVKFNVGDEFEVVTVSFDPRETPAIAAAKKQDYLKRYGRAGRSFGLAFSDRAGGVD